MVSTLNPFRYRGYYYDTETGLYYLQSWYYNPATGRFINADGYVNAKMTGKDVLTTKGVHPSVKKSALNDVNQYNKALEGLFGRALGGTSACTGANNLIVFMGQKAMNYAFGWDF